MWHNDENSPNYSNLYLPPVSQLRNYVMSQSPADGGAFYERLQVPPMSTNTHPIQSIGEISTGEDEDNVFQSISEDSEGIQGNPESFSNVLTHMPARSESRFSRRFNNTVDRLGGMAEELMGFQMENPAVARPPAVARSPAGQGTTQGQSSRRSILISQRL
ncbi:hypothetical protein GCK72_020727 [Caenorhabditis remanei]|uniref:Uncharacterized protein n=1 Tax=Caenorhabditis remanei TaxID=31234 RepID=A0A6A5GG21_CAERE|nr:hypothetical protein GCK72_020727 [Caenorhabditis remanei]KAF1754167.1 hypothetical protein GCK72_020727 [Caenorhabditis remanei]